MLNGENNLIRRGDPMITFNSRGGNFDQLKRYLMKASSLTIRVLDKYGKMGVDALASATPVDSGRTADSWGYDIEVAGGKSTISFFNSNINKGVNIAIILDTGHGTGTGGWVAGREYIDPTIQPVFDEIVEAAWKEVTSL